MKKKVLAIAAALMMATAPAMAQVFIMEEDDYNGKRQNTPSGQLSVDLPGIYNSGEDWYTPVGEGLLVLAGLAGAYLVGKRRKEE
ncbi:MAG: hypothetical protein IJK36_08910 [Bacteroidales bacterium]|nr:hypothetical protein [Bacteroidales bacterium]MBR0540322.1 hypothetical protein [Bacteroidales bacterium]